MDKIRRGLTRAGKGRPPGALNKATREIREAARLLLEDTDYRALLRRRLIAGKAPHMETLLHQYAYGKPKDVIEQVVSEPVQVVHVYCTGDKCHNGSALIGH
jgi:hypothetical protein